MISIIICSTKSNINDILHKNIKDTIGIPYELIIIDNTNNNYSIFSAYNEGVKRSKFPYLCFIHEDIIFRTDNWGYLIHKAFESDQQIGMIGVIGSTMIFDMSWGWWTGPKVGKIIQSNKSQKVTSTFIKCIDENPNLLDAAICDGLFLSFPKSVFSKICFDEQTYKGFHGYDMDISMQILTAKYKIKVIENVLIEHYSWGNINESFINACYKFYCKWKIYLPISSSNISEEELNKCQEVYLKDIIRICPENDILKSKKWKIFKWFSNKFC